MENIVEQVLGLSFDWDEIDEQPEESILGGLDAKSRLLLLNEKHPSLIEEKPGLEPNGSSFSFISSMPSFYLPRPSSRVATRPTRSRKTTHCRKPDPLD